MAHGRSMQDPPGVGMEPASPALTGRIFFFLTTEPPGKPTDVPNEKKFMREEG